MGTDGLPKCLDVSFIFFSVEARNERATSTMNLVVLQDALRVKNITWIYLRSSFTSLVTLRTSGPQPDQYKVCSRSQIAELDIKMHLQLRLISSSATFNQWTCGHELFWGLWLCFPTGSSHSLKRWAGRDILNPREGRSGRWVILVVKRISSCILSPPPPLILHSHLLCQIGKMGTSSLKALEDRCL